MQRLLPSAAFAAGLLTLAWVAAGQWPGHPGALLVTVLIAVGYLAGARELARFRRETALLDEALAALGDGTTPPAGEAWMAPLPPSLQAVVRARLDGVRGPLPGPAMAPALAGLLVLLGMLGTFLGLIVTFRGTVLSLEGLTDLSAMRAALAAPVQGLGQAFGASVAGVATSAMLGLMIALARRERAAAGQRLDARIATVLRPLTPAWRQQQIVDALQAQATQLPVLVERMNALADGLVRQGEQLQADWLSGQQAHHAQLERLVAEQARRQESAFEQLARDTQSRLETLARDTHERFAALDGLTREQVGTLAQRTGDAVETLTGRSGEQLDRLGQTLQAAVQAHLDESARRLDERGREGLAQTLSLLGRESAALHERVAGHLAAQVEGLTGRVSAATEGIEARWLGALARHEAQGEAMLTGLREALAGAASAWQDRGQALVTALEEREQRRDAAMAARADALLGGLETRAEALTRSLAEGTDRTLATLSGQGEATLRALSEEGAATLRTLADEGRGTLHGLGEQGEATLAALARHGEATLGALSERAAALVQDAGAAQAMLAGRVGEELQAVGREVTGVLSRLGAESAELQATQTASMRGLVDTLQQAWAEIDGRQRGLMDQQSAHVERTMAQVVDGFRHEAAALVATVEAAQAQAQTARAEGDERRLAAWQAGLEALADTLHGQWQASGEAAARRAEDTQRQLQASAEALAEDHRARTRATLDEIATLMQAAAEAPRAAADLVAGLREQLAASLAQDRALLDERGALLEGVRGLLDAAQAASVRQGEAVQGLVDASRDMLEATGARFAAQVEGTATQLVEAAAGVRGGIAEVAGLGEVFAQAVQRFGESNAQLGGQLQRIEAALGQAMSRSDDQMAYYVTQARELIDLSLLSQKRIVDELQRSAAAVSAATPTREAGDA